MTTNTITITGLDHQRVGLTAAHLDGLRSRLDGTVLQAADDGWDDAVLIWNAMVARTPAVVVQPSSADDVVAAVGFARDHGLLLSIKGGGHNIAGTSIAEGALTIDMCRMRDVTVDVDALTAY